MASQITVSIVCSAVCFGAEQKKPTKAQQSLSNLMASSDGTIFRVTGPLWGKSTGHRWIILAKGQWRGKCSHLMKSSCLIIPTKQLIQEIHRRTNEWSIRLLSAIVARQLDSKSRLPCNTAVHAKLRSHQDGHCLRIPIFSYGENQAAFNNGSQN